MEVVVGQGELMRQRQSRAAWIFSIHYSGGDISDHEKETGNVSSAGRRSPRSVHEISYYYTQ
jgi:hypothetical protein